MSLIKDLAKATGKSVDEILEYLGKNVDEAPNIIGKGKNLEALQAAKVGAPDLENISRKYPKGFQQDELAERSDFILKGEPYSKDFSLSGADVPAIRQNTLPDIPAVAKETNLPTIRQNTLPDTPVLATPASKGLSKPVAALSGLAAGGILGNQFMGNSDIPPVQIPYDINPQQPKIVKPLIAQPEKDDQKVEAEVKKAVEQIKPKTEQPKKEEVKSEEKKESPEQAVLNRYLKMVEDAQKQKETDNALQMMVRGSERFAAGASGGLLKPDYSGSDLFGEQAKARQAGVQERIKADQLDRDLKQEMELDDPNNNAIPLVKDTFKKAFDMDLPEGITLRQLSKMGLNVSNILSQKEANEARKETAALQREYMQSNREESNKLKIQGSLDKVTAEVLKSDDYKSMKNAEEASALLDFAIESGRKEAGGAAFMKFAKVAQGDNSVVRDGDMRVLAGGYNYKSPAEMLAKLESKAAGGDFGPEEFKQMKEVVELAKQIKNKNLQARLEPVRKRAESAGLDLSETLSPDLLNTNLTQQEQKAAQSDANREVIVTRLADGKRVRMPFSKTLKMDKSKYSVSE